MWQDPIVAETRILRDEYVRQFNYDADAIFKDLMAKQATHPERMVSFPPRKPIASAVASQQGVARDVSLDNQVDKLKYHPSEIKKEIGHIEENSVSPEEKARMIEESYVEEAIIKGIELGKVEIAKTMLAKNLSVSVIMELTGLDEPTILTLE
ncbi:MAG: hypothetical protein ACOYMW_04695 [Candidatus Competibacteraceae bacterium]